MAAQSLAPVILLTRPATQSARFAERLELPTARIVISPLIAPVFLRPTLPDGPFAALVLTSETGVEAAAQYAGLPKRAFCVGDRTALAAQSAGFSATSAQGDAEALVGLILSNPSAPLLHLRGREARGDIAKRLSAHGLPTAEAVVYAQEEQPLTPEATALLQGQTPVLAPVFSPRSAEILAAECHRVSAKAPMTIVAMSAAVAKAASRMDAVVFTAAEPTAESMAVAVRAQWVARQGA